MTETNTNIEDLDTQCNDSGNTERLIKEYGALFRYCIPLGGWLHWTGVRWEVDNAAIWKPAGEIGRLILHDAANADNNHVRDTLIKHGRQTLNEPRIRKMIELAKVDERLKIKESALFDSDPYLFNCYSGTVNLKTGELREHDREDLITKLAPVSYDPTATAPNWTAFLDRVLPKDLQEYLQTAVGYTAIGTTYEHILLILYGTGANGKSTFVEALRPVFGEFAYRTSTDTLMVSDKGGGSATPDIANLRGRRFVTASESEETATLAESLIKDLTGGDEIRGRHLYADPINFVPSHTLWLSTNHKPLIKGTDNGIWRRVKLVPFNKAIPEKEQDKKLPEKLKYESSGILNWIIAGAMKYEAGGLVEPGAVKRQTEVYRHDLDRLAQFIEEECALDHHFTTPLGDFYKAYESWVLAAGSREKPEGKQHFGQKLESKGYRKDRSNGVYIWRGIKLKDAGELLPPTL